jgi:hypothetical protein
LDVSTRNFSRRDLLQLGGRLALSIGAAKIVIALPGCGGDDGGTGGGDDQHPMDGGGSGSGSSYYDGYYTLDDCHSIGTYNYVHSTYSGYYYYSYHYTYTHAYACNHDGYHSTGSGYIDCSIEPGFMPNYDYLCYSGYTYDVTYTYNP